MVVDAGGPGAALDQLAYGDAYGDAYGKALSEGIAVLGGFGGRDDLDAAATHSVVAAVASEAAMKAPGALDAPSPPSPAHVSASATRAVEHILVLVPLAATVLRPVLLARMPHATAPKPIQTWYLRNAFRLVESDAGACLRDPLLAGVVKHMLEMDVEIKWEDIRAPRRGDDGDEGASSASDDPDESDVDDDLDDDDDEANDDTGEGRGGGIFELEDIERTIEEQLVAQVLNGHGVLATVCFGSCGMNSY